MYIPLHLHTTHSFGDSILTIEELIPRLKELGVNSCAITDHGTMSNVYAFHEKLTKNNIKPILGCEFYIKDSEDEKKRYHIIALAKNKEGFENLLYLHNYSQLEGFNKKPMISFDKLSDHSKGLVITTACVGGEIPQLIVNREVEKARELIKLYKSTFDDFYLEIQPGNFIEQIAVNNELIEISKELNVPLVLSNDIHYLNKEDYMAHNIHVLARRKKKDDSELVYPDTCYYLMDEKEISSLCFNIDPMVLKSAINNTTSISNLIESYDIKQPSMCIPSYEDYSEEDCMEIIEDLCFKELNILESTLLDITDYVDRIYHELSVISSLKFGGYFMIVRDYVKYAMDNDVETNAGRGSICASLVGYLIGIHKVDPIKYDLLFGRFLSSHRISPPDVDMDFDAEKRDSVFSYVIDKYGEDRCALVSTFSTRKAKAAIKDTGRVYGHSQDYFDEVAKLIPTAYYQDDEDGGTEKKTDLSILETMELVPKFKEIGENNVSWFNSAIKLCDLPKTTSIHAAGTLIAPIPLHTALPLIRNTKTNMLATSLNLSDAENVGFLKFDFLSIATLTTINKVKKLAGIKDIYKEIGECDDENVWNLIGSKDLAGLFQISSNTYKQRMYRLAPRTIEELSACLALVRGPCISSKADEKYMRIVEGKEEIELIHPLYDSVVRDTNGVLVYQEQLMELCNNIGFTLDESYKILKACAKKKIEQIEEYGNEFRELSSLKGIDEETSDRLFKIVKDSGLYSFNEAHAVGYSLCTYATAYLKTYYPVEFYAATLTNAYERKNDIDEIVREIYSKGIKFLPLSINSSTWDFKEEDGNIRIGFSSISGLGKAASKEIDRIKPIGGLEDFLERVDRSLCNKRAIVPLCLLGAFSEDRSSDYENFYILSKAKLEEDFYLQDTRSRMSIYEDDKDIETAFMKFPYMNGEDNSLDKIDLDSIRNNSIFAVNGIIKRVKKIKDKNGNNMAFISLLTGSGLIDVTVFKGEYELFKRELKKDKSISLMLKKGKGYILNNVL